MSLVHNNSVAASRAFELLLQPIIDTTWMIDVAAVKNFYLNARFQCIKTHTASNCVVFNLFLFPFSGRWRDAACNWLLDQRWLLEFERGDRVYYVSNFLFRSQWLAIFVHRLWLLKNIFIIIIQLFLSIFIRFNIVVLILALVIHGLLVRSCMELLLLSSVNSLTV